MLILFVLQRNVELDKGPIHDATLGFVIAAMNEIEARKIAASYRRRPIRQFGDGDEALEIWYASTTSCTRIGIASDDITSGVILRDYSG